MKITTVKTFVICTSLLYWSAALGGDTIQKCVDAKGAVTFADRCPSNQQAIDTGVLIDTRSDEQKAQDEVNIQKYLEELEKQSKITSTPTAIPVAQPTSMETNSELSETSDDDDYRECLSSSRNCLGYNTSNLTPAQKALLLHRLKEQQQPARIKRR